ncbi:MAG: protein-methionine-sulfoxide reductase heme-binding subunit MsrQ [Paracoccaceae bacterium]
MTIAQTINGALRRVPAWPLYIIGPIPAFWYLYLALTGGLGVEPIKGLEHAVGLFGLKLFIAVLAITPLCKYTKISLIKYRRALGLLVFFYISCHLLVWLVLDVQILSEIWADILKRPYITIGMISFLLMIPISITSNNWSIRKLGPVNWKRWHWLTYPAVILGGVHYIMLVKGWQTAPLVYMGIILVLLAMRLKLPKAAVVGGVTIAKVR